MNVSLTKSPEIDPATVAAAPAPCPAPTGDTDMTEQYEMNAAAIATAIWEISTGNGRDLNRDDWHSHMQNCHAAVANSYTDGITQAAWHKAALARAV